MVYPWSWPLGDMVQEVRFALLQSFLPRPVVDRRVSPWPRDSILFFRRLGGSCLWLADHRLATLPLQSVLVKCAVLQRDRQVRGCLGCIGLLLLYGLVRLELAVAFLGVEGAGEVIVPRPRQLVRLVLAVVGEGGLFTLMADLVALFGPLTLDAVVAGRRNTLLLLKAAYIIEVALLFTPLALVGVFLCPFLLEVGLVCVWGWLLAGPGEQELLIVVSR